jgi:hypothetical protein
MIELVDPRGDVNLAPAVLALRRHAGEVRRIAFLSNEEEFMHGALHFQRYTRILQRVLPERLGDGLVFHSEVKPVLSRAAEQEQIDHFVGWDAVINGLAK